MLKISRNFSFENANDHSCHHTTNELRKFLAGWYRDRSINQDVTKRQIHQLLCNFFSSWPHNLYIMIGPLFLSFWNTGWLECPILGGLSSISWYPSLHVQLFMDQQCHKSMPGWSLPAGQHWWWQRSTGGGSTMARPGAAAPAARQWDMNTRYQHPSFVQGTVAAHLKSRWCRTWCQDAHWDGNAGASPDSLAAEQIRYPIGYPIG